MLIHFSIWLSLKMGNGIVPVPMKRHDFLSIRQSAVNWLSGFMKEKRCGCAVVYQDIAIPALA